MQNDIFTNSPVHKAYFKMSLPVVFSMIISLVYNMADTYFIAGTGNTDLVAGVSLGAPVFTLMIALGDIFGLGGSSVISRMFGQKEDDDAKRISVFSFYGAILCGILVIIIMIGFKTPILYMLGADSDTFRYANEYYTGIVLGAPLIILTFTPSNQLRTEGLSNESMIGSILGAVINIILDPIFIYLFGMGAAGAAIATDIGYVFTDVYFIWVFLKKSKKLSINPKGFYIRKSELLSIMAIGIPASITNLMQSLATMLTNRALLPYGNEEVAAMGIVMKVNMIAALVLVGFAFGPQPLIGYSYGANDKKRLRDILSFCYKFECGLALVLAVILAATAKPMITVFMDNPRIVSSGVLMLRAIQCGMVFMAVVLVTTCIFQSTGKAVGAFCLSISRQGIIFAIVLFIAGRVAGYNGIIAAQPISDFLTAILAIILFKKMLGGFLKK